MKAIAIEHKKILASPEQSLQKPQSSGQLVRRYSGRVGRIIDPGPTRSLKKEI